MKKALLAVAFSGLMSSALAAPTTAMVTSDSPYLLHEAASAEALQVSTLQPLAAGGAIEAQNTPVRVAESDGSALLISPGSRAVRNAGSAWTLERGVAVASFTPDANGSLTVGELIIQPLAAGTEGETILSVERIRADRVQIRGFNGAVTVSNAAEQIGVVGTGDSLIFTQAANGSWDVAVEQTGAPVNLFRMQTQDGSVVLDDEGEDDDDDELLLLLLLGGGVAGATYAGYEIYDHNDDDDDGDDEEEPRGRPSPVGGIFF